MRKNKVYVVHDCRRCKEDKCNNRFIFEDKTNAKDRPPAWAYCPECCKELGIDFKKQKPSDYRTQEENERIDKLKNSRSVRDNLPD